MVLYIGTLLFSSVNDRKILLLSKMATTTSPESFMMNDGTLAIRPDLYSKLPGPDPEAWKMDMDMVMSKTNSPHPDPGAPKKGKSVSRLHHQVPATPPRDLSKLPVCPNVKLGHKAEKNARVFRCDRDGKPVPATPPRVLPKLPECPNVKLVHRAEKQRTSACPDGWVELPSGFCKSPKGKLFHWDNMRALFEEQHGAGSWDTAKERHNLGCTPSEK